MESVPPAMRVSVDKILKADERILATIVGNHSEAIVITSARVLVIKQEKKLRRAQIEPVISYWLLDEVQELTLRRGLMEGTVTVTPVNSSRRGILKPHGIGLDAIAVGRSGFGATRDANALLERMRAASRYSVAVSVDEVDEAPAGRVTPMLSEDV